RSLRSLMAKTQRSVDLSGLQQALDRPDADVAPGLHVFGAQIHGAVGIVQLLRTLARGPLRLETGQNAGNLVAVHAIAALVGASAGSVLDAASGNGLGNDIG